MPPGVLEHGARPVDVPPHPQVEVGLGRAAHHAGQVEDDVRRAKSRPDGGQVAGHRAHPRVGRHVGRGAARSAMTISSTGPARRRRPRTGPASSRLTSSVPMNPAPPVTMTRMPTALS